MGGLLSNKPSTFDALLKEAYYSYQGDCSDFVRRCAELAPRYEIAVTVRVFDIPEGRHAAVEYLDENRKAWIGDIIYAKPIPKDKYRKQMNTQGL